jgi:cytochrome c oxidase subunit IV
MSAHHPPATHPVHDTSDEAARPGEDHLSITTYLVIWAALLVLLVVTVAVAYVDVGPLNIVIALAVAIVKAVLVVWFFMHVKFASRLTKIFVSASVLWLAILFALTFADYITRPWLPVSRGWNETFSTPEMGQGAYEADEGPRGDERDPASP